MSIANELITRGWHQGDYEGPGGSVCLEQAMRLACAPDRFYAGLAAIGAAVKECASGLFVHEWNDEPGRTFDEVLRAAKEADEILDAQP